MNLAGLGDRLSTLFDGLSPLGTIFVMFLGTLADRTSKTFRTLSKVIVLTSVFFSDNGACFNHVEIHGSRVERRPVL